MGTISKDKNVIKIFYNPTSINDKEAKAYFASSEKNVLAIDTVHNEVTPTQWSQLLEGLNKDPIDLIDKNHPILKEKDIILDGSFSIDDWLKIITKNPEIISGVVAIVGEDYLHFKSQKSIIEFIGNDADSNNSQRN